MDQQDTWEVVEAAVNGQLTRWGFDPDSTLAQHLSKQSLANVMANLDVDPSGAALHELFESPAPDLGFIATPEKANALEALRDGPDGYIQAKPYEEKLVGALEAIGARAAFAALQPAAAESMAEPGQGDVNPGSMTRSTPRLNGRQ